MIPSIRPFTTFLLSVTLLLGHAPAWLHVATCNHDVCHHGLCDHGPDSAGHTAHGNADHGHIASLPPEFSDAFATKDDTHQQCCHLHGCAETEQASPQKESPAALLEFVKDNRSQHDSHSCWICQSLAAPTGLIDHDQTLITCEWIEFASWPMCPSADVDPSISWPPLRGPPMRLA
ncbi:MAG: hypothetical protein CMM00_15885 [Rhodopirellula sp.]|uniref:Signal peptide protein n=1 Tax=Rhodopirellula europaea SH398 TaxID=1263868 RepID=M5S9C2_9BACT|nr:hypothetical protein [Rhodopirellula europaea]EMI28095.1 signal peptide protein [Rhodopirellula europaea SH398]MAP10187.1 hypothetical protein [Rhodopirellula sp.]MCR9209841.1 hypothetical protein [bacterium]